MFYKPPGHTWATVPHFFILLLLLLGVGRSVVEKQRKMCRRVRSKKSIVKTRDGHQAKVETLVCLLSCYCNNHNRKETLKGSKTTTTTTTTTVREKMLACYSHV
jgi:hypothetical protein